MKYVSKGILAQPSRHEATRDVLSLAVGADPEAAGEARAFLERLSASKDDARKKQYDFVADRYIWFARKNRRDPWAGDSNIVAAWLYLTARNHTRQSIMDRAGIIRQVFIGRGLPDPLHDPLVARTLDALTTEAPTRRRTHEIHSMSDFRALKRTLSTSSLAGLRDTVALGFGFILMLRPESILRLTTTDVSVIGDRLEVRSTYRAQALLQTIVRDEGDGLVDHLRDYVQRAGIGDGPLFPAIRNDRAVGKKAIEKSFLDRMYKERLILAGFDPTRYCWTSLRYGFLYFAYQRNIGDVELCKRAGFDTFGRLERIIDGIGSGTGGFRLAGTDSRTPQPILNFALDPANSR